MVKIFAKGVVIVKALALGWNIRALTSAGAERRMLIWLEDAKVAVSLGPLGTVAGVQFVAVFQLLLCGLRVQVALPAKA